MKKIREHDESSLFEGVEINTISCKGQPLYEVRKAVEVDPLKSKPFIVQFSIAFLDENFRPALVDYFNQFGDQYNLDRYYFKKSGRLSNAPKSQYNPDLYLNHALNGTLVTGFATNEQASQYVTNAEKDIVRLFEKCADIYLSALNAHSNLSETKEVAPKARRKPDIETFVAKMTTSEFTYKTRRLYEIKSGIRIDPTKEKPFIVRLSITVLDRDFWKAVVDYYKPMAFNERLESYFIRNTGHVTNNPSDPGFSGFLTQAIQDNVEISFDTHTKANRFIYKVENNIERFFSKNAYLHREGLGQ